MAAKKHSGRGSLGAYDLKRDFALSPEPRGASPRASTEQRFVLHRHEASHLHWDLRLEEGGVLRSFAIPKGVAWDPTVKRLAVRTEDHPIEYLDFEAVIPPGAYGAGRMSIEDRGRYTALPGHDVARGLEKGELKLVFFGRRLRGEWHLVRMKAKPGEASEQWLLFKAKDVYALASPFARGCDFSRAPSADLPARLRFAEAREHEVVDGDARWGFEVDFETAFDGRRVFFERSASTLRFRGSSQAAALTKRLDADLSSLAQEALGVAAERFVVDAVLVATQDGEPVRSGGDGHALYASDIVYYEDWDLRPLPLRERKRVLEALLADGRHFLHVLPVEADGQGLATALAVRGHTTMLAKDLDSSYGDAARGAWRRVAIAQMAERSEAPETRRDAPATRRALRITKRDKVWFPHDGVTKGDVLDYYARIANVLVPFLRDRPLTLQRFPDGIEAEGFFQKNLPDHAPAWLDRVRIEGRTSGRAIDYLVIDSQDALLFAVQEGGFELHPWLSRRGSLDEPDFVLIDLDPKTAPFEDVVTIAGLVREILDEAALHAILKTSGQSGLHILVPLAPGYGYDIARRFAEGIARIVVQRLPRIATIERDPKRRAGRVYIDYLQNRRGQTVVAPFSLRPRPGAMVSTPLAWDEVGPDLDPRDFTLRSVVRELERRAALLAGLPGLTPTTPGQKLEAALDRLLHWLGPKGA